MADLANPGDFSTTLGPDCVFKGELTFDKGLRLQGRMEGKINTPGRLHVAKEAKMQADVEAGAIIVEGEVHGNLTANDRIELKNTARYEGDLRASKLVVDEGAVFSGHVSVGPEAIKGGGRKEGAAAAPSVARPMAVPQAQPVK
jgi:cytoskeletal protein CcmA (bactofilin family)